jgi:hypothetical protein
VTATTEPAPPRRRGRRVLIGLTVGIIAAMWIYAFGPFPKPRPADQLDDPRFAAEAEEICEATVARLNRLPLVTQDSPPQELAEVVTEANRELAAMVARLRAVAPTEGRDGRLVGRWLDDWDIHLDDRDRWVERVEGGVVEPFTETEVREGFGVTGYLSEFAEVNGMRACRAPEYQSVPD